MIAGLPALDSANLPGYVEFMSKNTPLLRSGDGTGLWNLAAMLITLAIIAPLLAVVWIALTPSENPWLHLITTVLPRYLTNSLILMLSVGCITGIIGTGTAWLVANRSFPGRGILQIALLAPLAIPAYIGAYALVDFLEYAGPVQTGLRGLFGWENTRAYWFPDIRSMPVAVLVLSLSLYPYVYLLSRIAFEEQGMNTLDVARALGASPLSTFWRVSLPAARPAIVAGIAIVMMEVLNDFGTVEFFAIQTLTTGIFTLWLDAGNAGGAAQIACLMLALVLILFVVEKITRHRRKFHSLSRAPRPIIRQELRGGAGFLAMVVCALPVLLGFFLPISILIAIGDFGAWGSGALWRAAANTLGLGFAAAGIAILGAVALTQATRYATTRWIRRLTPVTTIGYAVPGAVLAIGVLIPLGRADHALADLIEALTGIDPGLLFTGSVAAIVIAYVVRFFAIAQGAVESAMARVSPSMDMAARSLGRGRLSTLARLHLPMIRGSILTAFVLIFVDAIKELPATLILRPFNFDTLATRAYNFASVEDLERAAPAALLVVAAGLIPVFLAAWPVIRRPRSATAENLVTNPAT